MSCLVPPSYVVRRNEGGGAEIELAFWSLQFAGIAVSERRRRVPLVQGCLTVVPCCVAAGAGAGVVGGGDDIDNGDGSSDEGDDGEGDGPARSWSYRRGRWLSSQRRPREVRHVRETHRGDSPLFCLDVVVTTWYCCRVFTRSCAECYSRIPRIPLKLCSTFRYR